jgi:ribonuclease E
MAKKKRTTKKTTRKTAASAGAPKGDPLKQMVINYTPGQECRIALVQDGRLEEFHAERANAVSFVGNVYVGKVTNVESAIQAAFVDFGIGANGFLHISDLHPMYFPGEDEQTRERIGKKTPRRERPPIQACLKRGQEIIVQVLKEGIGVKGPTLTSYLSIPGRYLVMLPNMDRVGVSRKVEDEDERKKMKQLLDGLELPPEFGFIIRTAGADKNKTELKRDLAYLQRLWKDLERRRSKGRGPRLLYAESDLLMRALRDYWTNDVHEIVIDNESALRRSARFMKIVSPRSATRLLHYDRPTPVFHAFGLEEQIQMTHEREVPLPSGGSLVIDETEAMIAIDVNSGKSRSQDDAENTAYRTNIEAIGEISRQLRLRDIGGLVLCDLIDMMKRSNRRDIESRFREHLKSDRAATKILPISQFGIVEMTRQRMRSSLRSVHYTKCPTCSGRGLLRRPGSAAADALRELAALLDQPKVKSAELVVSPRLSGELLSGKRQQLTLLEYKSGKSVSVRVSEDIPVDRFTLYAYDESGADLDLERLSKTKPPRDLPEWERSEPAGEDWAVDSRAEQEAVEIPVPEPPEEPEPEFLGDDLDVPALDDEGAQPKPKRSRRRKRRGSRSGGGGEAAESEPAEAPAAAADAAPGDGARAEGEDGEARSGSRKRGRRRRKRKSDGEPGAPEADGEAAAAPAASGPSPGDSWDLSPEELRSLRRGGKGGAEAPAVDGPAAQPEAAPEAESGAPEAGSESGESPEPEAAPAEGSEGEPEPASKKKRSRRRGGRKKASSKAAVGEGSEDAGGGGDATPASAEAKPAGGRTRKKAASSTPAGADPTDDLINPVPTSKPVRTLYGRQRKKPSPDALRAKQVRDS